MDQHEPPKEKLGQMESSPQDVAEAVSDKAGLLPGLMPIRTIKRVPKGHGHECWCVEGERRAVMVKVGLKGTTTIATANLAEALRLANMAGVPCPKMLWRGVGTNALEGRPMFIQEFLTGIDGEEALAELDEHSRNRYFFDWGAAVGRLHSAFAGCFSNSISQPERCCATWTQLIAERLRRLIPANKDAGTLDPSDLSAIESRIEEAAERLGKTVVPALAHCDPYPPNTLLQHDRFIALLDFEHAKFMDPVYDFVKLGLWVFEPLRDSRSPFWDGYLTVTVGPDRFEERLWICLGMELLAGLPYWMRLGEREAFDDYSRRLRRWLTQT